MHLIYKSDPFNPHSSQMLHSHKCSLHSDSSWSTRTTPIIKHVVPDWRTDTIKEKKYPTKKKNPIRNKAWCWSLSAIISFAYKCIVVKIVLQDTQNDHKEKVLARSSPRQVPTLSCERTLSVIMSCSNVLWVMLLNIEELRISPTS